MLQCTWQCIKADIGLMHSFFVVLWCMVFFGKISLSLLPHTDKTICAIHNLATSDVLHCYYSTIHSDAKTHIIYKTPPNMIWCVVVAVTTGPLLYHWNCYKSTGVLWLQLAILYGHCYDSIYGTYAPRDAYGVILRFVIRLRRTFAWYFQGWANNCQFCRVRCPWRTTI